MATIINLTEKWRECDGTIPIFPLPDTVLLPQEVVPLHIFEPRYRQMLNDVRSSQRLMGMALLKPGWEVNYDTKEAAVHSQICIGYVAADQQLSDGRSLIILQGVSRGVIERELDTDDPYRLMRCRLISDRQVNEPSIDRAHRHRELMNRYLQLLPKLNLAEAGMVPTERNDLSLGALCDLLASTLSLSADEKLNVLQEIDVDERSELVLRLIKQRLRSELHGGKLEFPPRFSKN
ncbi:MAG: LON peptidase substrate-binding domain-containing protein [Planctomycetota bacterium]|nr:LON peptidase substrate-binding domain-containing protein [Planctomycetota bacterium]MDA1212387.1 LON peptidase substrate-binding domain-containing protein [Planctomycetota bacterium]